MKNVVLCAIYLYALNRLSGKINGGSLNLFVDNNY